MRDTLEEFNRAYSEKEQWAREMGIYGFAEKLQRERDEARKEVDNIRKMLSESGEAIGNGNHNYSIIEMIQNLIRSKSYFIRKSYAEFFKPVINEEGVK